MAGQATAAAAKGSGEALRSAGIRIDMRVVMERQHQAYAQMIAPMVQENAELYAGLEAAQARVAELEAQVAALRDIDVPRSPAASGSPGG